MTDLWQHLSPQSKVRIGYLVAGVVTGVLWLAHDGSPLDHALRLLALMATVMTVSWAVHRIAEATGRDLPRHPVGRFLLAKVAVVALALVAAVALEGWLADVDFWVAVGMGTVVTLLGPALHPWLIDADADATDDEAMERLAVVR